MEAAPATKQTELDELLFELTGADEHSFFALMRQELDPWAAIDEVLEQIKAIPNTEAFQEKCEDFKRTFDQSLTENYLDRENETHQEDKWDTRYSARDFRMDVQGITPKAKFITDTASRRVREEWQRTTGNSDELWHLTEWGNFSMDITKRFHKSLLKVQTQVRKNIPYLGVGSVQINMITGNAHCHVNGCKWEYYLNAHTDKEGMEFQVLLILQHLGIHSRTNSRNYWTPILEVKRFRDNPEAKAEGRMEILTNGAGGGAGGVGAVGVAGEVGR